MPTRWTPVTQLGFSEGEPLGRKATRRWWLGRLRAQGPAWRAKASKCACAPGVGTPLGEHNDDAAILLNRSYFGCSGHLSRGVGKPNTEQRASEGDIERKIPQDGTGPTCLPTPSHPKQSVTDTDTVPTVGSRIGRYLIIREVAQGVLGPLFIAEREVGEGVAYGLARVVNLPPDLPAHDEQSIADAIWDSTHINHELALRVADVITGKGYITLIHEHSEGSLLSYLQTCAQRSQGAFPAKVASRVALDVIEGLEQSRDLCANAGIPWRPGSVSPSSLLLGPDGRVRAMDGQITAAALRVPTLRRRPGVAVYAAPELLDDTREPNERTDVFAVGVLLWELLTGRSLFAEQGSSSGLGHGFRVPKVAQSVPPGTKVPQGLVHTVHTALEADPSRRQASLRELAVAIVMGVEDVSTYEQVLEFTDGILLAAASDPPAAPPVPAAAESAVEPAEKSVDAAPLSGPVAGPVIFSVETPAAAVAAELTAPSESTPASGEPAPKSRDSENRPTMPSEEFVNAPCGDDMGAALDSRPTPGAAAASTATPLSPDSAVAPANPEVAAAPASPEFAVAPANPEVAAAPANPEVAAAPANPEVVAAPANPEVVAAPANPEVAVASASTTTPLSPDSAAAPAEVAAASVNPEVAAASASPEADEITGRRTALTDAGAPSSSGVAPAQQRDETPSAEHRQRLGTLPGHGEDGAQPSPSVPPPSAGPFRLVHDEPFVPIAVKPVQVIRDPEPAKPSQPPSSSPPSPASAPAAPVATSEPAMLSVSPKRTVQLSLGTIVFGILTTVLAVVVVMLVIQQRSPDQAANARAAPDRAATPAAGHAEQSSDRVEGEPARPAPAAVPLTDAGSGAPAAARGDNRKHSSAMPNKPGNKPAAAESDTRTDSKAEQPPSRNFIPNEL